MYIEQLQKFKINLWTYIIIPGLAFLGLMVYNYISTKGIDTSRYDEKNDKSYWC